MNYCYYDKRDNTNILRVIGVIKEVNINAIDPHYKY